MGEELPSRSFFPVQEEVRRLFQELIHQPWGGKALLRPTIGNRVSICVRPLRRSSLR